MKFNDESSLTIIAPNGGEAFETGTFQNIIWKGGDGVKAVKIEYSADNGSAYRTVIDRAPNTGTFPWRAPADPSGSCLIRISDADGTPTMPVAVSFEFNFRISAPEGDSPAASHFIFRAGLPDPRTQSYQVAEVAFAPDGLAGCENLLFNLAMGKVLDIYIPPRPPTLSLPSGRWEALARRITSLHDFARAIVGQGFFKVGS